MHQFNPYFIDHYLIFFLKKVTTDAVQNPEQYHDLLLKGQLIQNEPEKERFRLRYFVRPNTDAGRIPFRGSTEEAIKEQLWFIAFLENWMRKFGALDTRRKFFLPAKQADSLDAKGLPAIQWPESVVLNLRKLAYGIARGFEKGTIQELIERGKNGRTLTESQAKKMDRANKKGQLMLTKSESGKFDRYLSAREVKPGQKIVPLVTPPADRSYYFYGDVSWIFKAQDSNSTPLPGLPAERSEEEIALTAESIFADFYNRTMAALPLILAEEELEIIAAEFDEKTGQATLQIKSGADTLSVQVDSPKDPQEELKFVFVFMSGKNVGRRFELMESELDQYFKNEDGSPVSVEKVFEKYLQNHLENLPEQGLLKPQAPAAAVSPVAPSPPMKADAFSLPQKQPNEKVNEEVKKPAEKAPTAFGFTGGQAVSMPSFQMRQGVASGKTAPKIPQYKPVHTLTPMAAKKKLLQKPQRAGSQVPAFLNPLLAAKAVPQPAPRRKRKKNNVVKWALAASGVGAGMLGGAIGYAHLFTLTT